MGAAFILHEMAHKFTAMKFGYYAAFRKDNGMLLMGVALAALVGVVFAAPGATVIYGQPGRDMSKKENGIISVAGPVVNLCLVCYSLRLSSQDLPCRCCRSLSSERWVSQ
ncbi:hypothetical protein [Methanogenium cariaci]|uniref:hypothetical protein n=1 Tax=Methanogenium cariaci TaxID=2197 RepID=UPI001FDEB11F|nr:hypothetical protein [Methanogenium cariaci]